MNTPTSIPPTSPLAQQAKGKSNLRIVVITIIALHAVLFGGVLMQGCKQKTPDTNLTSGAQTNLDTNVFSGAPFGEPATNVPPVAPTQQVAQVQVPPAATTNLQPSPPPQVPQVTPPSATPPAPAPGASEYTVVAGDSLDRIARAHGLKWPELKKANPDVDPRRLKIGQRLIIPAAASAVPAPAGTDVSVQAPPAPRVVHQVKRGDTLSRIAAKYGVTLGDLRTANNLKTHRILVGQELKIPAAKAAATPKASSPQASSGGAESSTSAQPGVQ